ncbi:hypothetical protein [Lutimonas zeaxanthinifaciens]|uniref:hypothetical protein n=1 Tax=Lutimonas zeaxanthinifaciens TaxID=3060215 RepID=UPI00265D5A2D|nr:hypothetical protein [Lutimonas sp. YSD2104]WKK64722.1 hypothetical protein QZH61_08995 [Lutimonas sp. YSD2104]
MKKIVFILALSLIGFSTYAQEAQSGSKEKITKYVTTFPNGEEAITITDNSNSRDLELESSDNFYKYEILETSSHELVHGETNRGNVCAIDKTKLEEGTYTLKVYTEDFVITSDITIGESES